MKKILLCLQYYPGDQADGQALARLIADMEPAMTPHADFMLSARFDAAIDGELLKYLRHKFQNVYSFTTRNRSVGWPQGSNMQAWETIHHICRTVKKCRARNDPAWDYDAFLLFEPDCAPLRNTWIRELQQEWYVARQLVLGYYIDQCEGVQSHINGNCMMATDITEHVRHMRMPPGGTWDCEWWQHFSPFARFSSLIVSEYKYTGYTAATLWKVRERVACHPQHGQKIEPAFLHGVKDRSAYNLVRKKFLAKNIEIVIGG